VTSVAQKIFDHIERLTPVQLMTTRDVLHLGRRNNIDVTLWRLVKDGKLIRLARGVFSKPSSVDEKVCLPTPRAVATAKAAAFDKANN
jgi:hypothetical protein